MLFLFEFTFRLEGLNGVFLSCSTDSSLLPFVVSCLCGVMIFYISCLCWALMEISYLKELLLLVECFYFFSRFFKKVY